MNNHNALTNEKLHKGTLLVVLFAHVSVTSLLQKVDVDHLLEDL